MVIPKLHSKDTSCSRLPIKLISVLLSLSFRPYTRLESFRNFCSGKFVIHF